MGMSARQERGTSSKESADPARPAQALFAPNSELGLDAQLLPAIGDRGARRLWPSVGRSLAANPEAPPRFRHDSRQVPIVAPRVTPGAAVVQRTPQATAEQRRQVVEAAASWLQAMAAQVATMRRVAALARANTSGSANPHEESQRILNQARLGALMNNAISIFEAQRSDNPLVNFPDESPEQTLLGEAFAGAIEQFGLAIEEARANAQNLGAAVQAAEETAYRSNHLRWLEANPAAPLNAGIRDTFTQAEVDMSTRRHQQLTAEMANLAANVHRYNLAGNGADRLRIALLDSMYRLVQDQTTNTVSSLPDTTLQASIQPVLDQLTGIQWAVNQGVDRLQRAEARTRTYAGDPATHVADGDVLHAHFNTRDAGYATLLADRLARMARELNGQGLLTVHAPDPQDSNCALSSIGGLSSVVAHADANRFHFCQNVSVGDDATVSTVVHETVHAVIPALGAQSAVTPATETPRDRSYAYERIYSRLSTEEALDNAESYAYYIDQLLGVQVTRPSAPQDTVTGCTDTDPVYDAIARATYRMRLGAQWAGQNTGSNPSQNIINIVQHSFPGADAARAEEVVRNLSHIANRLNYVLPVECRTARDREARAGALVYGFSHAATAGGFQATTRSYPWTTVRVCPDWFTQSTDIREDSMTAVLALRNYGTLPTADVMAYVGLARFIQEEAHPSVAGRNLQQHQAADAP